MSDIKPTSSDDDTTEEITYMDSSSSSEEDETINKTNIIKYFFDIKPLSHYLFANVSNYDFKTWQDYFKISDDIKLRSLIFNKDWDEFFDEIENKQYYKNIEDKLFKKKNDKILPYPELLFNSFNIMSPKDIKVIFIGQDPYIDIKDFNGKKIPQAMGFSFSVPLNYPIPPSLINIYHNLLKFKHIQKFPTSGCLAGWIMQGAFMINSSLTTIYKESNAHKLLWKDFSNDLINYLNTKLNKIVFVVWGKDAHYLCLNVDPNKHFIITSSHPSSYAFKNNVSGYTYGKVKNLKDRKQIIYPSFESVDHFGQINNYLESVNKNKIFWDVLDYEKIFKL